MSAKIFGIGVNEVRASHDVDLTRSAEGLWTASLKVYCRYHDHGNASVQSQIARATPITDLHPSLPIFYSFLELESARITGQKGGITEITCQFSGSTDEGEYDPSEEPATTYSLRATLGERPIIEHPNYLAQVTASQDREAIAAWYYGQARPIVSATEVYILSKQDDDDYGAGAITDTTVRKWIDKILAGVRTYDAPQLEWSISQSRKNGLVGSDLDKFARADTPSGNPPEPSFAASGWWMFSGVTEDKTDSSSSFTLTWTLRDEELDTDIYDY